MQAAKQAERPPPKPPAWLHLSAPRRLRKWRATRGLNQFDAAQACGIDPAKYSAFETSRKRPSLDHAAMIERATDGIVKATAWAQTDDQIRRSKEHLRRSRAA